MKAKSKILSVESLPGCREITLNISFGGREEKHTLTKEDTYLLLTKILKIHVDSWSYPQGPYDIEEGETKPDLLYLVELKQPNLKENS